MKWSFRLASACLRAVIFTYLLFIDVSMYSVTTSSSGDRMWDIAITVESITDIVASKICELDLTIPTDFDQTHTAIQELDDAIEIVSSQFTSIESKVDILVLDAQILFSKVDVIFNELEDINQDIDTVHIDDFGGTWTALGVLEASLCDKFEEAFNDLIAIESQIDQLSTDNLVQFIATFTKLQVVAEDVFDTMTTIQDLSNQLNVDLSEIDYLVMDASITLESVQDAICNFESSLIYGFDGTFTVIAGIVDKLCAGIETLDNFSNTAASDFDDTFTTVQYLEQNTCSIDSKVDNLAVIANLVKSKINIIAQ